MLGYSLEYTCAQPSPSSEWDGKSLKDMLFPSKKTEDALQGYKPARSTPFFCVYKKRVC